MDRMTTDVAVPAAAPETRPSPVETASSPERSSAPAGRSGMKPPGGGLLVIERILRDRDGVWRQILAERDLPGLIGRMFANTAVALAIYGAVLGASSSPVQAVTSAVKLPLLFLLTLVICLPTLYLFNLVFGARLSIMQALSLVLVTLTVTATLSLAFAPISLFFLITAPNYAFLKLLNVAILALAGLVGVRFLIDGMHRLNRLTAEATARQVTTPATAVPPPTQAAPATAQVTWPVPPGMTGAPTATPGGPPPAPARATAPAAPTEQPIKSGLLYVWALLFGFVGTQLAWTLRPFFGSPSMKFEIFRRIDGNFYVDIVRTLGSLF